MQIAPDSWTKFEIINAIVNFLAGAQSLCFLYYSFSSDWTPSFKVTIVILSILNGLLIVITYKTLWNHHQDNVLNATLKITNRQQKAELQSYKGQLADSKEIHQKASIIIHNICHENRRILYYLLYDAPSATELQLLSIQSSFKKYFMFLLANVKEVFDVLTGDDCSACIKLIDGDGDIQTFMRDPVSYRHRHQTDRDLHLFNSKGNTAFNLIASEDFSNSYYVNDDLNKDKSYTNSNTKWRDYYNASIVTPIRISLPAKSDEEEEESYIIGFLCVDNQKGNFNNETCINTLSAIGDLCFHLFYIYDALEADQNTATE